jgi:hypothetical protein
MVHMRNFGLCFLLLTSDMSFADVAGPRNPGTASNIFGGWVWQNPTNILTVGAPYASVPLSDIFGSSDLQGSNYGFSIPDNATVLGIEVIVNKFTSAGSGTIVDASVCLLKNYYVTGVGREDGTTPWASSMTPVVYGGPADLWGSTWTPAEINAAGFAAELSARGTTSTASRTAYVDYIQVRVTYTMVLPVQLASFNSILSKDGVFLKWSTLSETNNYGFFVERRIAAEEDFMELPGAFIPGNGTTLIPQNYRYVDNMVNPGVWYYRLRQVDLDGTVYHTDAVRVEVVSTGTVSERSGLFTTYFLSQNYPNPFNPSTTIRYVLPQKSRVTLSVINTLGQEVANLVNGEYEAGFHETTFDASGLSSGVYFYRIQAGEFVATKRLLLLH